MPTTTADPRFGALTVYRALRAGEPIGDIEYRTFKAWRVTPPAPDRFDGWHVAVSVDVDVDGFRGETAGLQGILRLRLSDGTTSAPAFVDGPVARLILGWAPIPAAPTPVTVLLEAKRTVGGNFESVAIARAEALIVETPSVALVGGPTYPTGYVAPAPQLSWVLGSGAPVGATWTEFNLETAALTLVGGPAVNPNTGITLTAASQITGSPLPEPGDTFDVTLDITTPAATVAGHRFFNTKATNANTDPGVGVRFGDTTGGARIRISDAVGNNVTSPIITGITPGARQTVRVVKTAAQVELYVNGTLAGVMARPGGPTVGGGGGFTINGLPGAMGALAGDLTVHGVTITDGT